MKTIKRLELISAFQSHEFYELLGNLVAKCQEEGLEVEIQYQDSSNRYSALIVGSVNIIPYDQRCSDL
jgi:hypothetical protein